METESSIEAKWRLSTELATGTADGMNGSTSGGIVARFAGTPVPWIESKSARSGFQILNMEFTEVGVPQEMARSLRICPRWSGWNSKAAKSERFSARDGERKRETGDK